LFVDLLSYVLFVKHSPALLECFLNKNSTNLSHPGSGTTPVYFNGIQAQAQIVAINSSNENLVHLF